MPRNKDQGLETRSDCLRASRRPAALSGNSGSGTELGRAASPWLWAPAAILRDPGGEGGARLGVPPQRLSPSLSPSAVTGSFVLLADVRAGLGGFHEQSPPAAAAMAVEHGPPLGYQPGSHPLWAIALGEKHRKPSLPNWAVVMVKGTSIWEPGLVPCGCLFPSHLQESNSLGTCNMECCLRAGSACQPEVWILLASHTQH